ncbi:hypothetical protein [Metabacillus endolithicus]|uniref:DUF2642 domain-containing protein n=1 Tax=Metabacillus endolithicus TaxID=1535204 RepID=A0ABW5BUR9_9BACI|nr:hypothetical protein [Metabacillus endolithicus]UPG62838.1 hypothetical protein MVE64_20825 [Metabacillus endolithicus]
MSKKSNLDPSDINVLRDQAIIDYFTENIGQRAFVLTPSFPFMFVGEILDVMEDMVLIDVEATHFSQLENRTWFIHAHQIEIFYVEREGEARIPKLNDLS